MMFWMGLWKLCLIGGVAAFAVMAILVTILGAADVRRLLRKLNESRGEERAES